MSETDASASGGADDALRMHSLIWLAILLVVIWIVLRVVLAVTGVALHLLWVAAIVMFILWAIGKFRGKSA